MQTALQENEVFVSELNSSCYGREEEDQNCASAHIIGIRWASESASFIGGFAFPHPLSVSALKS